MVASVAQGQVPARDTAARTSAIAGLVRDSVDRPIPLATVTLDGRDLAAVTDSLGRFHLSGIPSGTNAFTVLRLGYEPSSFTATLPPDSTVVITIRLRRVPTLDPVSVRAAALRDRLAKRGYYERQRRGIGSFVSPERVDSLQHLTTPARMLRDVPGLTVRCAAAGRCEIRTRQTDLCMHLFVNGSLQRGQLDDILSTTEVAAFEIYQRPALVPIEFQGHLAQSVRRPGARETVRAGCGAIVVWRK
jgi:hypothetical protein